MNERLGSVSYKQSEDDPFLGREIHRQRQFSERTMEQIHQEVAKILHGADEAARDLLIEQREALEKLTRQLIREEELDESEITAILGPSVHAAKAKADSEQPH